MKLYGIEDEGFGDMGDFTGKIYMPLDFNTVAPLLVRKPAKLFSICENTFNKLLELLTKKLTKIDSKRDLLILMRVKQDNYNDKNKKDTMTPK